MVVLNCIGVCELEIALEFGEEKHPADEIALALSRAGGILSSLSHCYNASATDFAIGASFIAEAIKSTEAILAKASESLTKLYHDYSLDALHEEPQIDEIEAVEPAEEEIPVLDISRIKNRSNGSNSFSQPMPLPKRLNRLDMMQRIEDDEVENVTVEQMIDQPAETYQELLEKLTAMADAASTQQNSAENSLVPILESLRADMLRMKTA
jgi:fructose-specific phosphotransferase system component IIB